MDVQLLKRRVKTSTVAEVLGLDDSSASISPAIPLVDLSEPPSTKKVAKGVEKETSPSSTPAPESTHAVCSSVHAPQPQS
jgi:hypothetical protein